MRQLEAEFNTAGAQIIWVLQELNFNALASSEDAHNYYSSTIQATTGLRVGDAETEPVAGTFESSPFITSNRGFAMIVRKADMRVVFADFHGNERNLTGQDILDEVNAVQAP